METNAKPSVRPFDRWPRAILRRVAEKHGVALEDMEGPCRAAKLTRARREGAIALREEGYSVTLICRVLGKDNVTVWEYLNADYRLRRNAERAQVLREHRLGLR